MENQKETNEIDLLSILTAFWRQIKKFCAFIKRYSVWSVRFAYKNRTYMVCALICAILFTAYWARPANRKYQMESELRINVLDAFYFNALVENVNYMCANHDYKNLSKSMNISENVSTVLSSAHSFYIVDKLCDGTPDEVCYDKFVADTTKMIMKDRLMLRIVVADTSLTDSIANGLIHYFSNNRYVLQNNKERILQMDDKIYSLENEVSMLDSMRKYEYFERSKKEMKLEGPLIVSEKNKELYYNDILTLEKLRDKSSFDRAVNSNSVDLVREFVLVKVKNSYVLTFVVSCLLFGLGFFTLALLKRKKGSIKSFLEK